MDLNLVTISAYAILFSILAILAFVKFVWNWFEPCRANDLCPSCFGAGNSSGWYKVFRVVEGIKEGEDVPCPTCYGEGTFRAFERWNKEYRSRK